MYNPIPEPEMHRLMEESCRGNKTGKTDFGFVPKKSAAIVLEVKKLV